MIFKTVTSLKRSLGVIFFLSILYVLPGIAKAAPGTTATAVWDAVSSVSNGTLNNNVDVEGQTYNGPSGYPAVLTDPIDLTGLNGTAAMPAVYTPGQSFFITGNAVTRVNSSGETKVYLFFSDPVPFGQAFSGSKTDPRNYPYGWISGWNGHSSAEINFSVPGYAGSSYTLTPISLGMPSTSFSWNKMFGIPATVTSTIPYSTQRYEFRNWGYDGDQGNSVTLPSLLSNTLPASSYTNTDRFGEFPGTSPSTNPNRAGVIPSEYGVLTTAGSIWMDSGNTTGKNAGVTVGPTTNAPFTAPSIAGAYQIPVYMMVRNYDIDGDVSNTDYLIKIAGNIVFYVQTPTPINLKALTNCNKDQVTFSWTAVPGATSYTINDTWATGSKQIVVSGITSTTTSYDSSVTHSYTITATDGNTVSTPSAVTSATKTLVCPVVTLWADTTPISVGSASSLSWLMSNISSCTGSSTNPMGLAFPVGPWSTGNSGSHLSTGILNIAGTYTYTLSCSSSLGTVSPVSATITVTGPPPVLPSVPGNLTSSSQCGIPSQTLAWTPSTNATGYYVYHSDTTATGAYQALNSTDYTLTFNSVLNAFIFSDISSRVSGQTYWYKVEAVNANGYSGFAGPISQVAPYECNNPITSLTLTASPTTVTNGSSSILTWVPTNATSCVASGGNSYWNGSSLATTTTSWNTGALFTTTTFTASCTGPGGTISQSATVDVSSSLTLLVSLSANPSSGVTPFTSILTATVSGTALAAGHSKNALTASAGDLLALATVSYQFDCGTGSGFGAPQSLSSANCLYNTAGTFMAAAKVTANSITTIGTTSIIAASANAPTVTLVANPVTVMNGSSSILTWTTTHAASCTATGGNVFWNGSSLATTTTSWNTGALTTSTTFGISCTGVSGGTATSSATVNVSSLNPSVTLTANPTSVTSGNSSTLTWVPTNATSCTASGGNSYWNGSSLATTTTSWNTGALTGPTTFTITCNGSFGTTPAMANVAVTISPPSSGPSVSCSLSSVSMPVPSGTSVSTLASVTGGSGSYTYSFDPVDGTNQTQTQTSSSQVSFAHTYTNNTASISVANPTVTVTAGTPMPSPTSCTQTVTVSPSGAGPAGLISLTLHTSNSATLFSQYLRIPSGTSFDIAWNIDPSYKLATCQTTITPPNTSWPSTWSWNGLSIADLAGTINGNAFTNTTDTADVGTYVFTLSCNTKLNGSGTQTSTTSTLRVTDSNIGEF